MTRKKLIKRIIIIATAIIVAVCIIVGLVRHSKKITGTEWFMQQQQYIEQFEALADETDDVTALYIAGNMSEDDFITHVELLRSELMIMEAAYNKDESEVDIKNGTQTELSLRGSESVPACFEAFYGLYEAMEAACDDTSTLAYVYLAYGQEMTDAVANYETSMNLLYLEMIGEEDSEENGTEKEGETSEENGYINEEQGESVTGAEEDNAE